MKNIKTFESFNEDVKPERFSVSTYITKSDWFSLLKKNQRDIVKKLAGKEIPLKPEMTPDGVKYIIQTGDESMPTIEIPKRFINTY